MTAPLGAATNKSAKSPDRGPALQMPAHSPYRQAVLKPVSRPKADGPILRHCSANGCCHPTGFRAEICESNMSKMLRVPLKSFRWEHHDTAHSKCCNSRRRSRVTVVPAMRQSSSTARRAQIPGVVGGLQIRPPRTDLPSREDRFVRSCLVRFNQPNRLSRKAGANAVGFAQSNSRRRREKICVGWPVCKEQNRQFS